jgi:membrane protein
MRLHVYARLAQQAGQAWIDDRAPSMGAAIAYYTLFSLAPLLLIVVSVAGLLFGADAARGAIFSELEGLLGAASAAAVQSLLESVNRPADGALNTLIGLLLMLLGATSVFAELQSTLDQIWQAPQRAQGGLWQLMRARVLSFGLILGLGFLLIVSLFLGAALSALQRWWSPFFGSWLTLMVVVNHVLNFAMVTATFAMIYKVMPRVRVDWSDVWTGALVTALLFTAGRFFIGLYISSSAVGSGFGAAGSIVVLMVWVYYSAQIFLLGAEFTWVYAHALGSRRGQARPRPTPAPPAH